MGFETCSKQWTLQRARSAGHGSRRPDAAGKGRRICFTAERPDAQAFAGHGNCRAAPLRNRADTERSVDLRISIISGKAFIKKERSSKHG